MIDQPKQQSSLFVFVGEVSLIFAMLSLNGWVLKYLWNWFIAAPLHEPYLGTIEAIGICLVMRHLTFWDNETPKKKTHAEDAQEILLRVSLKLCTLGIGWVFHALAVR